MDEIELVICDHCGNVYYPKVEKSEGGEFNQGGYECPVCKKFTEQNHYKEFVLTD